MTNKQKTKKKNWTQDTIQLIYEVCCIPLFYIMLVNEIAVSNLSMFSDPDNTPENIKMINAIAALYLCNPLYSFLCTAPDGLFRLMDYIKVIYTGEIDKDTPWLVEHQLYRRARKNPIITLQIGGVAFIFVSVSMGLVFLSLGASGAKIVAAELNNHTDLSDEYALAIGSSAGLTNLVLYTYALTENISSLYYPSKERKKETTNYKQCLYQQFTIDNACRLPSIGYSSPYAKAGFETIQLVAQLSFLQPLQGNHLFATLYRIVFIMGIEIILLRTFKSPYTKFNEKIENLDTNGRTRFSRYKITCLLLSTLPLLSFYSIFPVALVSSTLVEKALLNYLSGSSHQPHRQHDPIATVQDPLLQVEEGNATAGAAEEKVTTLQSTQQMIKISRCPYKAIMAVLLVANIVGAVSAIALTLDSDPSKTGLNLFKQTTAFCQLTVVKYIALVAIATTGIGANMLGVEGVLALMFGYLGEQQAESTQQPNSEEQVENEIYRQDRKSNDNSASCCS